MTHNELKMRCDLSSTGANTHRVIQLYSRVISSIQLYLLNDGDEFFLKGVEALHALNTMIGTSAKFVDLIKSYEEQFDHDWGCVAKVCLGTECKRPKCIKKN